MSAELDITLPKWRFMYNLDVAELLRVPIVIFALRSIENCFNETITTKQNSLNTRL